MADLIREMPPLVYRWHPETKPLPRRAVRVPRGRHSASFAGQPWYDTGPHGSPLDFSDCIGRLLDDIVVRCEEWAHLRVPQILIGFTQARAGRLHGLQARVTPLRFKQGHLQRQHRGTVFQIQRYFNDNHEYLYLMTFCLPRFLDQDFDHKLVTLFHELYHISPEFNGDLRRHQGRYHLHSHSKKGYDREMTHFARAYMSARPDPRLTAFLRLNFKQLCQRHEKVLGIVVPRPKMIPLPSPGAFAAFHGT